MDDITKHLEAIHTMLPEGEILAQLAEEASELAQAALKLRRAAGTINPTPVTLEQAKANLVEELVDVEICLCVLGICEPKEAGPEMRNKVLRWHERLNSRTET